MSRYKLWNLFINQFRWSRSFVAKVDSSGNFLFSKSATGSTFDAGFNIAVDSIGNVCIVGYYQSSSLTFGSTTISNSGDVDLFVAKLSFATSLNDVSSNENLIAFPNPSNGSFYLDHRFDKYVFRYIMFLAN